MTVKPVKRRELPRETDRSITLHCYTNYKKILSCQKKVRISVFNQDLRLRIVDLHKAGKGYKSVSKSLDVHQSTVRQIVYKWRKFRSGLCDGHSNTLTLLSLSHFAMVIKAKQFYFCFIRPKEISPKRTIFVPMCSCKP